MLNVLNSEKQLQQQQQQQQQRQRSQLASELSQNRNQEFKARCLFSPLGETSYVWLFNHANLYKYIYTYIYHD